MSAYMRNVDEEQQRETVPGAENAPLYAENPLNFSIG